METPPASVITPPTVQVVAPEAPPWWLQFSINSGIMVLHQVLHNPHQAAYLKSTLLALRDAISATYPDPVEQ